MFKKILIANRGEIAVRVIRACKEMGIESVAVYSEIDRTAQHVRLADEAYLVGAAPSAESYLVIDRIIETALKSGADAIHPGYGFLAENADFAKKVNKAGLIFIGPTAETISLLGDKMTARQRMIESEVPVVPGFEQQVTAIKEALKFAEKIGYPVLIKAAAGGGGKGMRVVKQPQEMEKSLQMAQSEAKSAFGDDRIYIEKYLEGPRHVEIQIIADNFGNVVHLGERECSIQRRHQKVIEESPSPIVDDALRKKMGDTAVKAAKAANYINAGTVEFLVDQNRDFYFLEVNTRLQVEHPVTEMVTGIDLAKEQISVAAGKRLSFTQNDVTLRGAAIECRIYAEDPENNFLPSIGNIQSYHEPQGPCVRVDSGLGLQSQVSLYYDPLISKLLTWGRNREEAINRMKRALDEYKITGVHTVIPFHKLVMNNNKFIAGDLSTHFIEEEFTNKKWDFDGDEEALKAMAIMTCLVDYQRKDRATAIQKSKETAKVSLWKQYGRKINRLL